MPSIMKTSLVALALFLAGAAWADECEPTTSNPEIEVLGFYIDNDVCQPECLFSIWIYEESNGIEGLQRSDEVKDDTCGGQIEGDTLPCSILPVALLSRRSPGDVPAARGQAIGAIAFVAIAGSVLAVPTAHAC